MELNHEILNDLGISPERAQELIEFIIRIVDRDNSGKLGHLLLDISGSDMTITEKVFCAFALSYREGEGTISKYDIETDNKFSGKKVVNCMVVAPTGIANSEMLAVMMASLLSILKQSPKDVMIDFSSRARQKQGK